MRGMICGFFAVMVAGASADAAVLFSIGQKDDSYAEFAIAGKHAEYPVRFPSDVVYRVGESLQSEAWPFIQPGRNDAWAGSKEHPFRIEFTLDAPPPYCRLVVYIRDSHATMPSRLKAVLNDGTERILPVPAGGGDASLSNPASGRPSVCSFVYPAADFHAGANTLTLTALDGSWILYDAVVLESFDRMEPEVSSITAACTPYFKTIDGQLMQAVRVRIENGGIPGEASLAIVGVPLASKTITLVDGPNDINLFCPPFTQQETKQLLLDVAGKRTELGFDARPYRQWKVYVAPSTHTDIGYTNYQERAIAGHIENTTRALDACAASPDFRWNLEVFAQAEWFNTMGPYQRAALEENVANGRIGLTSMRLNMLTGICSGEEMAEVLRPAQDYAKAVGVQVLAATLTDVPSAVGTLPMFLRHAGVRYFAEGLNCTRGPVFPVADKAMTESPFWWEAFDGSRVLTVFTAGYSQADGIGICLNMGAMEERLAGFLAARELDTYPCDAIYINGAFSDNISMQPDYAANIAAWNKEWDFPKVILSRVDEYFQYVEKDFSDKLPVFKGDMGVYWEDGAASSAMETRTVRHARAQLQASTTWQTLAAAVKGDESAFDEDAIRAVWEDVIYYDEHTWGAAGSISEPNAEQTRAQWARKAAYATAAELGAADAAVAARLACESLTGARSGDKSLEHMMVFNALSWPRDITVSVEGTNGAVPIMDETSGQPVASQSDGEGGMLFTAVQVPAFGYKRFHIEPADSTATPAPLLSPTGDPFRWDTPRFHLAIDPATGALASIVDIQTGREWVDTSRGYGVNQYLYVKGGGGTSIEQPGAAAMPPLKPTTHAKAVVTLAENGSVRSVLRIERTGDSVDALGTDLIIHANGRITFDNTLRKTETLEKEAGYFAFPIRLDNPTAAHAYIELPYGIVDAGQEQPKGACLEWYSANTFAAVSDGAATACIATPDSPFFTVGDMNRGAWPTTLGDNKNTLFAYPFNNYWFTNYKASQSGDMVFSYTLDLTEKAFCPVSATRFGWEYMDDAVPHLVFPFMNERTSDTFFHMEDGPVLVGGLTWRDNRLVARLYNPTDTAAQAVVAPAGLKASGAHTANLFGDPIAPLPLEDGAASVPVPGRGIAIVAFDMGG